LKGTVRDGNTSGGAATGMGPAVRETREATTGQDMERNRAMETNSPAVVLVVMEQHQWVWHHRRAQRSSGRDWSGHGERVGMRGILARSRGETGQVWTRKKK